MNNVSISFIEALVCQSPGSSEYNFKLVEEIRRLLVIVVAEEVVETKLLAGLYALRFYRNSDEHLPEVKLQRDLEVIQEIPGRLRSRFGAGIWGPLFILSSGIRSVPDSREYARTGGGRKALDLAG